MIITVYGADGTKTRTPLGYAGGQCNVATEPYEAREIHGQVAKTATSDACVVDYAAVKETINVGG